MDTYKPSLLDLPTEVLHRIGGFLMPEPMGYSY